MANCKMNPNSIKLELVSLVVFSTLLIAMSLVLYQYAIPVTYGLDFIGIPLALISAAFGIPAAKLPQHRAYAITASIFAVLSAFCFVISTCSYIYAVSVLYSAPVEKDNAFYILLVAIAVAVLVFCTTLTCALATKTIQTAIHHRSPCPNGENSCRSTLVVLSPTDNSYLKMPPPLPIGEEFPRDLPPPYVQQAEKQ